MTRLFSALFCTAILAGQPGSLAAQAEPPAKVPELSEIEPVDRALKPALDERYSSLLKQFTISNDAAIKWNTKYGEQAFKEGSAEARAAMQQKDQIFKDLLSYGGDVGVFNADVSHLRLSSNPKVYPAAPVEPPVPVIDEEAEFYKDPIGWHERQELRVRHAVFLQKKWTAEILKYIKARTSPPATKFAELSAGDVLLVSPVPFTKDPKEYLKGQAIALGDRELRALTAFAKGDLWAALTTKTADLSHSLTFIREVNGRKFFLDHDTEGTVVIDDRQFLKEYGERGMMVARPLEIVDGRDLWQAAKDLALNQRGYGVTGDRVVCSEMCAIAVARATKTNYSGGNLGPIDVTPADFYDKNGNVGKHFVITRLAVTPAPEKK